MSPTPPPPTPLTSTRNPRVQAAASLTRRRERRRTGSHLVEGPRAVAEALAAGVVTEVFATADTWPDDLGPQADTIARYEVPDHVLAAVADAHSPQGIVAVATTPAASLDALADARLVVLLDQVADPGNVGTVVRTADAAGADAVVVLTGGADPFGPKAVRAAVGSSYHLPVVTDVDLEVAARTLRAAGHRLLGLDAAGDRSIHDLVAADAPLTLVLGSEAHGLSDPAALDGTLRVPIARRAESLNAAAAAAVALFAASSALGSVPSR